MEIYLGEQSYQVTFLLIVPLYSLDLRSKISCIIFPLHIPH